VNRLKCECSLGLAGLVVSSGITASQVISREGPNLLHRTAAIGLLVLGLVWPGPVGSQFLCAQSLRTDAGSDTAWIELHLLAPTPGSDKVAFESQRPGQSSATTLVLSDIVLQAQDGPVVVRQMRVTVGRETIEFPIRRALAPGETVGPFAIKVSGAVSRIVVDIQPDRQSTARISVLVPSAVSSAVAAARAPTQTQLPASLNGLSQLGTTTFGAQGTHGAQGALADDRVAVRIGPAKGRHTQIAFYMRHGAVTLRGVRILYATGETQDVPFARQFVEGEVASPIILEREGFISEIQYRVTASSPRAVIDLYGALSDGWTGDAGESKTYSAGWVLLGLRRPTADDLGRDIPVTADVGRLKKMRFTAREASVTLTSVIVVFDDGDRATFPVGQTLSKDQTSQPIKLEETGIGRRIAAIIFPPASKIATRRDSYIEVWGQN
jgi:hypothetical protein